MQNKVVLFSAQPETIVSARERENSLNSLISDSGYFRRLPEFFRKKPVFTKNASAHLPEVLAFFPGKLAFLTGKLAHSPGKLAHSPKKLAFLPKKLAFLPGKLAQLAEKTDCLTDKRAFFRTISIDFPAISNKSGVRPAMGLSLVLCRIFTTYFFYPFIN